MVDLVIDNALQRAQIVAGLLPAAEQYVKERISDQYRNKSNTESQTRQEVK